MEGCLLSRCFLQTSQAQVGVSESLDAAQRAAKTWRQVNGVVFESDNGADRPMICGWQAVPWYQAKCMCNTWPTDRWSGADEGGKLLQVSLIQACFAAVSCRKNVEGAVGPRIRDVGITGQHWRT